MVVEVVVVVVGGAGGAHTGWNFWMNSNSYFTKYHYRLTRYETSITYFGISQNFDEQFSVDG